jgi:hypothetical protein
MTAIRRYSVEEFSEILRVWFDYSEPAVETKRNFNMWDYEIVPHVEVEVKSTLTLSFPEYVNLESTYKGFLKELGSDFFNYLMDRKTPDLKTPGGSFKLVGFSDVWKNIKKRVENFPELPIIHILECPVETLPLYVNSPVEKVAEIARLRLKFGR